MQKLDVRTLDGWRLDYFTGLALGYEMLIPNNGAGPVYLAINDRAAFEPTRIPAVVTTVLGCMQSVLRVGKTQNWQARAVGCSDFAGGPTVAVAVCRALVLHTLGAEVSLPGKYAASPHVPCVDSYQSNSEDCEDLFA